MRYMQMIKRCKLPFEGMKKAGPDLEASGEEPAKRCRMSTPDLKSPNWEERLGPLRNSAVARLLVEGKLPSDYQSPAPVDPHVAMDLSKTGTKLAAMRETRMGQLIKSEPPEYGDANAELLRRRMREEMAALSSSGPVADRGAGGWKCRFCPYTAHTSKTLYSHYQFHQQLLTSQSSKPHIEWVTAYRKAKEGPDDSQSTASPVSTSPLMKSPNDYAISPGGLPPLAPPPGFSLRCLLGGQSPHQNETQNSASGFLRSIVQAVMQQGGNPAKSTSTTSIYASLVNGSVPGACASPASSTASGGQQLDYRSTRDSLSSASADWSPTSTGKSFSDVVDKSEDDAARETVVLSRIETPKEKVPNGYHATSSGKGQGDFSYSNGINESQHDVAVKKKSPLTPSHLLPHRPPSRNSYTSESSDTSSSSEEINVDDVDIPSLDHRPRTSSCASEASEHQMSLLMSRKRSYSFDSTNSGSSSRSPRLDSERTPAHAEERHGYERLNESIELDGHSAAKSPRLDCLNSPSRARHVQLNGHRSPRNIFSSPDNPLQNSPVVNNALDCNNLQGACAQVSESGSEEGTERSIQCDLLVPPGNQACHGFHGDNPDPFGSGRSVPGCVRCPHCGIIFDDSVLHSIHMGCHNHSDPFVCNVCGEQCSNKYGFYTHIMRGHHSMVPVSS